MIKQTCLLVLIIFICIVTGNQLFAGGMGTGFLVNAEGYILTNNHVVSKTPDKTRKKVSNTQSQWEDLSIRQKATRRQKISTGGVCKSLTVKNSTYEGRAKIVKRDTVNDLALLKIPVDTDSRHILFSSYNAEQGESISVMGFPLGTHISEELKINGGIIVGLSGPKNDSTLMQIDAAINPGNSGGPVLNNRGQLVGIIVAGIPSAAGFNFAIKAGIAESFLQSSGIVLEKGNKRGKMARNKLYKKGLKSVFLVICG